MNANLQMILNAVTYTIPDVWVFEKKHMNTRERRENQTVVRHQGQIYKDKILCKLYNNYSYTKTTMCWGHGIEDVILPQKEKTQTSSLTSVRIY